MLISNLEMSEGAEIAATIAADTLVLRIYDGEYVFTCPMALYEGASVTDACEQIRKYGIKQEIPISFIDVTEYELPEITEAFRFVESFLIDEDNEIYMVRVLSELGRLDEIPEFSEGDLVLDSLSEEDIPAYAELCRSEEVNRLFGYDYKEDYEDAEDSHFYNVAKTEEEQGIALTLAIRFKGEFAGEASLFAFDYLGGATVALRLLPKFFGRGIGTHALGAILLVAREMDIKTVLGPIKKENLPSIGMAKKLMTRVGENDEAVIFEKTWDKP